MGRININSLIIILLLVSKSSSLAGNVVEYGKRDRPPKMKLQSFLIGKYRNVVTIMQCAAMCKYSKGCTSYLFGKATPPDECYTTASHKQYTGRWNITETGRPCQAFTAQTPHAHKLIDDSLYPDGTVAAAGSNCRDPDNEGFLWCYTLDPAKRWESCDIDRCTDDNCFIYSTFQAATVDLGVYEYYQALP